MSQSTADYGFQSSFSVINPFSSLLKLSPFAFLPLINYPKWKDLAQAHEMTAFLRCPEVTNDTVSQTVYNLLFQIIHRSK